ncbi:MAG: ABC transporter permease [Candidatus Sericytochromatia bacterium]|nr:ABC transporter permease [Candidatus Sericytochromatia bacterium]
MESVKKLIRQLEFTLQEAVTNFIRSGWMTTIVITTMVASLSVFGAFWMLTKDFNYLADTMGSKLQIVAFLKQDAKLDKVNDQITKVEGVSKVDSIPREKGWKDLKSDLKNSLELDNIDNENPLPDTVQVTIDEAKNVEEVAKRIKAMPEIDEIKYSKELADYIEQLSKLVRTVGIAITAIFGLATLSIIVNTIRLAVNSRKNEIEIMRLVGATNWFIRMPFLLEGIFFGFCSAVCTSIVLVAWRTFSTEQIKKLFPFIPITEEPSLIWTVITYTMILSIIIGFLGSALSVTRYLSFEKATQEE